MRIVWSHYMWMDDWVDYLQRTDEMSSAFYQLNLWGDT